MLTLHANRPCSTLQIELDAQCLVILTTVPELLTGARIDAKSVRVAGLYAAYGPEPVLQDIDLVVEPGEFLSLLGPSGSGKTTLLRAVAGLERPTAGSVSIGEVIVADGSVWVPPERRDVGMVFQDGALFPHLSVADNVAFGLPKRQRHGKRIAELLDMVDLGGFGDRRPGTLSGGQAQRVSLARALAPAPSVLLLDEPFSALDAALRTQIRVDVHQILREVGVTTVFVTHDQDEAFVMGDRVAVLRDGVVEQVASPSRLYRHPANPWVAQFVGEANVVDGVAAQGFASTAIGSIPLQSSDEGLVSLLIRPEQLKLLPGESATITEVEYFGHDTRYGIEFDDGTRFSVRDSDARVRDHGERVGVTFAGEAVPCWPR